MARANVGTDDVIHLDPVFLVSQPDPAAQQTQEDILAQEAVDTEVEEAHKLLPAREKTTARNLISFTEGEVQRGDQAILGKFQASLDAHPPPGGTPDKLKLAAPTATTRLGRRYLALLDAVNNATGTRVLWVASATGQRLSFAGLTLRSQPNVILLDAAGGRNVLAVFGHEWGHTLEQMHPALFNEFQGKLFPLVRDWAVATGRVQPYYPGLSTEDVRKEFISNVIGDAFASQEFWDQLAAHSTQY
jgi:hypothetical protein